jgi:uncharacterized membrane protein (GlpM family)
MIPVVVSVLVIVLVAVVQERSRYLAAIIATMPLTAPLAMWIVFSASGGDHRQTAEFVGSMAAGFAASMIFLAACWFGFRQAWGFPVTLLVASAIWVAIVALVRLVGRWPR